MPSGYLYGGVCYATQNEAVSAMIPDFQFPTLAAGHLGFVANGSGVWKFYEFSVSGSSYVGIQAIVLPAVSFVDCVPSVSVFDPATFAAFWAGALFFTWGCWIVAKNAGLVLNSILRF